MKVQDNHKCIEYLSKVHKSMRIRHIESFSRIAMGLDGAPVKTVVLDVQLLNRDQRCLDYSIIRNRYAGIFNAHFVASLPYVLEEQCRMGAALLQYFTSRFNLLEYATIYTLGDGSGVMARSLVAASAGKIHALNCSPNIENQIAFNENRPEGAHFFHGPFYEVDTYSIKARGIHDFSSGFDMIYEDTTFQMYGPERLEPILLAKRNLKPGGIFALLEKLLQEEPEEFERRETQKDEDFKSLFFTAEQIYIKKSLIVSEMNSQLVTLHKIREVLQQVFSYGIVTWNSGNFYMILAGDDPDAILDLCESMVPPAIPDQFLYHKLPLKLFGCFPREPRFRHFLDSDF